MNKETVVDTTGIRWERTFWVYVIERGYESLQKSCSTIEEGRTEGKKYVHVGEVRIKEQLERVAETLPEMPVCT